MFDVQLVWNIHHLVYCRTMSSIDMDYGDGYDEDLAGLLSQDFGAPNDFTDVINNANILSNT